MINDGSVQTRQHSFINITMNIRETRILKKIRKGDKAAFEILFRQYYQGLCGYAESLVSNAGVAEEIVQDVFFNIWKNRKRLVIYTNWKAYLYRAVFNNSMMVLRKSKKEIMLDMNWALSQPGTEAIPSEELESRELGAAIKLAIESLPTRTGEIFRMSRFEGMKYAEIAAQLSISVKTVEANMGKALKALRISLEQFRNSA